MGGLDLLSNTDFCDLLENSDPEIAEMEQTLKNRNSKTERKNIKLSKMVKIMERCSSKKADNKSCVTERSIKLAMRATLKKI